MKTAISLLLGIGLLTHNAAAAIVQYEANLDGLQVVAPNASPAFGLGNFDFDTTTNALTVTSGTYQDLLGGATNLSLHGPAGPGVNGSLIFALVLDTPGAATGTFSGGGVLTPALATSLGAGNIYIVIRSQVFPGGEIRGQLFAVPAPGAVALLGFAGVVAMRRKR